MSNKLCRIAILSLFVLLPELVVAQKAPTVNLRGGFGFFYDGYRFNQTNLPSFRPRQPQSLTRFTADATITIGPDFSIPFSINFSGGQRNYNLPSLPDEKLVDYIQNPRNNISVNPTYKWAKAYLGTQTPKYSRLTTGDIGMFGAGVDLNPGLLILSVNYGKSQAGVPYDDLNQIDGAYQQNLFAARIGIGKIDGSKFTINVVKSTEDPESVSTTRNQPNQGQDALLPNALPTEILTVSPLLELKLGKSVYLSTETAASVFTNDVTGIKTNDQSSLLTALESVMTVNSTSNVGISNISALEYRNESFMIGGEVHYVDPGFQPAGFRTFERDVIDYLLKTDFRLAESKLMVNASFGVRSNNIHNTSIGTTNRSIANVNVFSQLSDVFSLNGNFANFGMRNKVVDNALKVEMINNSLSLTPTFQITSSRLSHVLAITGSQNLFDDLDPLTGDWQKTTSRALYANYQMIFNRVPLSTGLLAMVLKNSTPIADINIINAGYTIRYSLFDRKFKPSLMISYTNINQVDLSNDNRMQVNVKADYKLSKNFDFRSSYNFSNYQYGDLRPDASTAETKVQFGLVARF